MSEDITLKHICQEHLCNPYKLRGKLRSANLKPKNHRWRWAPDHPDLEKVHAIAKTLPKEE